MTKGSLQMAFLTIKQRMALYSLETLTGSMALLKVIIFLLFTNNIRAFAKKTHQSISDYFAHLRNGFILRCICLIGVHESKSVGCDIP